MAALSNVTSCSATLLLQMADAEGSCGCLTALMDCQEFEAGFDSAAAGLRICRSTTAHCTVGDLLHFVFLQASFMQHIASSCRVLQLQGACSCIG